MERNDIRREVHRDILPIHNMGIMRLKMVGYAAFLRVVLPSRSIYLVCTKDMNSPSQHGYDTYDAFCAIAAKKTELVPNNKQRIRISTYLPRVEWY